MSHKRKSDARARPGSPPTPGERLVAVCDRVRTGTPIAHACALEGVTRSVFYEWLEKDPQLAQRLAAARAEAAEAMRIELRALISEGSRGASAMLHLMERQHPDEYAPPPKRVEQTGKDGGPQEVAVSGAVTITLADAVRIARGESES